MKNYRQENMQFFPKIFICTLPYRALLFAVEIHGMNQKPAVCGYAAELLVQAIRTTYKKYGGRR